MYRSKLEIIGHRGFSAIAPENTLAAFDAAIQHQADAVEFDVQLSADRKPVIIHDATVDRTTNGTGNVRDLTLEDLKSLDAGSWFNPQFAAEKIPTLIEALDRLKDIRTYIYPEIKNSQDWQTTDIDNFVEILIQSGWEERAIVACFNEQFLEQIRQRSSKIRLAYLVNSLSTYQEKLPKAAADSNAIMMSQYQVLLDNPSLVQDSRNLGVDIVTWTVDERETLQKLTDIGIVRIATNSLFFK